MMSKVQEFHIIDRKKNIFSDDQYSIPLYQRDYAWEDKQIEQLIEDINDVPNNENYYLGSLIVAKQEEKKYEVVDGQQRLTTLFLLLNYLGCHTNKTLEFACREKSNYTLSHIDEIITQKSETYEDKYQQENIVAAIHIIAEKIKKLYPEKSTDKIKKTFIEKLKHVVLYRIEVPEHTDLNHYFEIMNTRGEQLEQSDVLKAKLMGTLKTAEDQTTFALIWDACRDMTGYVQMHFPTLIRKNLFGDGWQTIPFDDEDDFEQPQATPNQVAGKTIKELIKPNFKCDSDDGYTDDDSRVRFESIIDFPYFLLHTLKVYIALNDIKHEDNNKKLVDELLDDKKLTNTFERVLENGRRNRKKICPDVFAKEFIICLLRTRFLFDKYIIKREYINESSEGEWSLKELYVSGTKSQKTAYYRNTTVSYYSRNKDGDHEDNLMLQSALRVSYTSPKVMHWITHLLIWLSKQHQNDYIDINAYITQIETIARRPVKDFLKNKDWSLGVNTHHMVLNYLDYLLWKNDVNKYQNFVFEFRNSIEHWYPQNPSEGTFERWDNEDDLNSFGNICLLPRNINSRFSNMSPEAKKTTFKEMIEKGSIKLRIMSELTKGANASATWKTETWRNHEEEMIRILQDHCPQDDDCEDDTQQV